MQLAIVLDNQIKDSIENALEKYKREIKLPRGSQIANIIMIKGKIIEKIYQTPKGKRISSKDLE